MSVQSSLDHWQILQSILNAASGAHLAYLDNDFNFIQVNQAYADGCGLRPEELVGKSHFALFPHAENEAIFSRVRETDEAVRFRDKPFEFADQPQRGITYWDWTLAPVRVCGGQVLGYILSLAETTERRRAEDALRASEERSRDQATKLATVLDAVPALIWMTSDAQCRQITLNRAASEFARHFCGAAAAESMPRYRIMQNGVELDPHDRPLQFVARSGQELRNQTLEFHFDDGQVSFLLGDVVPVLDYKDRPAGAIACFVDITSRKQAEVALQESEERLRLALHASSMATWDWDITSGKIVWNEQGYLALGYQPGSIEPSYQAWASRVHPDDRPGAEAVLQLAMDQKTEYHTEFRAILPDGTVRWLEVRGRFYYDAAGKPVRCYGVMMDITDRRQAEHSLRLSEEGYRLLFDQNPDGVFVVDKTGKFTLVNPACEKICGYSDVELLQMTFMQLCTEDTLVPTIAEFQRSLMQQGRGEYETAVTGKNGQRVDLWITGEPLVVDGKVLAVYGTVKDITEQKRAARERENAVEFLNLVNECRSTGDIMSVAAEFFRNKSGCEAVGIRLRRGEDYPYYETRGFPQEFVLLESSLCTRDNRGRAKLDEDGNPLLECMCGNVICRRFDPFKQFFTARGNFWTNSTTELLASTSEADRQTATRNRCNGMGYESVALIALRCGQETLGLLQLNDKRRGLFTAHSMAMWERLADHLAIALSKFEAHEALEELNRTLEQRVCERTAELQMRSEQLARLTSELTMAEQRERQQLAQVLHDGLQQLLVAAKFRLNVLESAQDTHVRQEALKVGELLTNSIETSRSLTAELSPPVLKSGLVPALAWLVRWMREKHGLNVVLEAPDDSLAVAGDVTALLFQSIRELLFNVVKHAGVKEARISCTATATHVHILVSDDGCGFRVAQHKEHQAEGFGLFAIRERLDLLGGSIDISSAPGHGSRVMLVAPISESEAVEGEYTQPVGISQHAAGASEPSALNAKGPLRIVLVDDHAVVRRGLATLLQQEERFLIVGEAQDGLSAVEMVRRTLPDVVLMDISMPGMNGIEATRIVHSEFPNICIIGLSMHDDAHNGDLMRQAGAAAHLNKSGPVQNIVQTIIRYTAARG